MRAETAAACIRVARSLDGLPLWMEPHALRGMLEALGPRLGLQKSAGDDDDGPSLAEMKRSAERARLAMLVDQVETVSVGDGLCEYSLTPNGVAMIPVLGPLTNRYDWLSAMCGWTSYDVVGAMVRDAVASPRVRALLLDVDSPGGEAAGMLDCADLIREAAAVKPTWACANTFAASAAFGLASAASRLTVPRLATVGSVGVVGIHLDQSGYDAEMGLRYTPIYSGARKIDGWGHAPLSDEALATFQAMFDESRRKFAAAVAGFRGMSIEAVLATEAGVYDDQAAVDAGFADAVQSFDETLADLGERLRSGAAPRLLLTTPTPARETTMATKKPAPAAETDKPEEDEEEGKAKAAPETAAEGDDDDEEDDEEAAKGDGKKAADPADVAAYCAENGCARLAADLIREKATMDQVKSKVGAAAAIRAAAKDGARINPNMKAELAEMAEGAIAAGLSVDSARAKMWDRLVAAQSPEIRSAVSPDARGRDANGWDKAVSKVNARVS